MSDHKIKNREALLSHGDAGAKAQVLELTERVLHRLDARKRLHEMMPFDESLLAFYEEPELLEEFFQKMADYKIEVCQKVCVVCNRHFGSWLFLIFTSSEEREHRLFLPNRFFLRLFGFFADSIADIIGRVFFCFFRLGEEFFVKHRLDRCFLGSFFFESCFLGSCFLGNRLFLGYVHGQVGFVGDFVIVQLVFVNEAVLIRLFRGNSKSVVK